MSEELLIELLSEKYGEFSPIRLTGGYTNATFLLKDLQPPLVAKVAHEQNNDMQNEINCLKLMKETKIVPKYHESFKANQLQITIMDYCQGTNAQSIMDKSQLEVTKKIYQLLGKILAKEIHSNKFHSEPKGIKEANLKEVISNLNFIPAEMIKESHKLIHGIEDSQNDWVLTHGDYGVHNVLYSSEGEITVLDWEWSEWANPLTDIAWVCWFTSLHYSQHAKILNPLFINEYQKYRPINLSADELKGYCVYKVWKVLNKVENAPSEVQNEWVRRLKWTLDTVIVDF